MPHEKFINPWGPGGKYWPPKWMEENVLEKEKRSINKDVIGGDVINDSDTSWLISGNSNSKVEDFVFLPAQTKSDDLPFVKNVLNGDVDAVWPAGKKIKNRNTGEIVDSGVFKLRGQRFTNIEGNEVEGYTIRDFSFYIEEDKIGKTKLTEGWKLPDEFK